MLNALKFNPRLFSKIAADTKALRLGFWGNTWENWGYILLAFLFLYAIEAGYLTGLLFASRDIRQQDYRVLPTQYFGQFERENIKTPFPYPETVVSTEFNRPVGCLELTAEAYIPVINDTVQQPTGVQKCYSISEDNTNWVLFPWVVDSQAAGNFPGCATADGATLLTAATSPAFVGETQQAPASAACQNFVIFQPNVPAFGALARAPTPLRRKL